MKTRRMLSVILALAPAVALADSAAPPLDLDVPASSQAAPGAAADAVAAGGADSPGAYYGDTSAARGSASEDSPGRPFDSNGTRVSGAFSTGVGYAKGFGTGFSNAAELNVEKRTDDGKSYQLHIDVERSNGFPGAYDSRYRAIGPGYYGY